MSNQLWTREAAFAYIQSKTIVDETTGCHLWQGSLSRDGYGQISNSIFSIFGIRGVHRLVYALTNNHEFADRREQVLHSCHQRACCNIEHLSTGTPAQNSAQAVARGSTSRGERNGHAKLTERQVQIIRRMVHYGFRTCFIAKLFSVNYRAVSQIKHNKCWRYLPMPTMVYPSPFDLFARHQ